MRLRGGKMKKLVERLAELRRDVYLLRLGRQRLEWHHRYELLHVKSLFPSSDFPRQKNYYEDFSGIHALQVDRRLDMLKREFDQQLRAIDYKLRELERQIKKMEKKQKKKSFCEGK